MPSLMDAGMSMWNDLVVKRCDANALCVFHLIKRAEMPALPVYDRDGSFYDIATKRRTSRPGRFTLKWASRPL